MPLLTTKKVFWRAIVEELLWFIRADTNSKTLSEKGIRIWDANGSRSFLDANGFNEREEGDLGPWRHFGADYVDFKSDYNGKGVDQLKQVIEQIKNEPESRRIILSAWNVKDLNKMALPPCHTLCQFYVVNGELSCQLYQRSGDMAGDFVHTLGDAHVYLNHVEALKKQLEREPRAFPKIYFNGNFEKIEDFNVDSIILEDYNPYPALKMEMAV